MCKVSIIVPVYNVEKFIERTVKSILSQSYSDWEMLLIDDGSTDSSGEICNKLASECEKIKVICPYSLAYGEAGAGRVIPPKSDLVFEMELIKIEGNNEL